MATTVTLKPNAIDISGSTSGTTTLQATAVAGTTTLTLPAATDTLVGRATTDTLTNKTLTGAVMNGTVGATTPSTGAFTTLSATDVIKQTGNPSLAAAGATEAFVAHNTGYGAVLYGQGTTYDVALLDRNTTPRLTVTTTAVAVTGTISGTTTIGVGAATPSTSGAGITFPATQAASSNANTLDDYEEGTWTPSLGGTATYTVQQGQYTKIGRMVNIRCNIEVLLLGTGSTTTISGLPFTSFATSNSNPTASASVGYFASLAVSPVYISAYVASNDTTMNVAGLTAAGATSNAALAVFGNSARIDFTVTYFV